MCEFVECNRCFLGHVGDGRCYARLLSLPAKSELLRLALCEPLGRAAVQDRLFRRLQGYVYISHSLADRSGKPVRYVGVRQRLRTGDHVLFALMAGFREHGNGHGSYVAHIHRTNR